MNVRGFKCFGSSGKARLYQVDEKLVNIINEKLRSATNIWNPLFVILGKESDELSALNRQFEVKARALHEVRDEINNLRNTARIGCPGTSIAERLERMSEDVDGEIKNNKDTQANHNQKI